MSLQWLKAFILRRLRVIRAAVLLVCVILLYQNCGSGGFETQTLSSVNLASSTSAPGQTTPEGAATPVPTMTATPIAGGTPTTVPTATPIPTPTPVPTPVDLNADLMVSVKNADIVRSGEDLIFKIEFSKVSATAITVQLETVAGTALPAVDYSELKTSVVIPAGQTSATVKVKTLVGPAAASELKTLSVKAISTTGGKLLMPTGAGTMKARIKLQTFKQISTGTSNTCGVTLNSTVKCWGDNGLLRIGNGLASGITYVPYEIPGLTGIKQVSAGCTHACALTDAGTVKCWGNNSSGNLGNGTKIDSAVPVEVPNLKGVQSVMATWYSTSAIAANGDLLTWGDLYIGASSTPTVMPYKGVTQTAGSINFLSMAVLSTGGKVTTLQDQIAAVAKADLSLLQAGVKQIAYGTTHICAITAQDTVKCWGGNYRGALGAAGITESTVPLEVPGLKGVKAVAAAENSTCAITADDTVKCWGDNTYGQTGRPVTVSSEVPYEIPGLTGIKQISGTYHHVCALTQQNTLKCWGEGTWGQLGLGVGLSPTPVDFTEAVP